MQQQALSLGGFTLAQDIEALRRRLEELENRIAVLEASADGVIQDINTDRGAIRDLSDRVDNLEMEASRG